MYLKHQKPYTLAGFEPGIFCSVGGRDHHYATPPRLFFSLKKNIFYLPLFLK
jgi:hypothetical protein